MQIKKKIQVKNQNQWEKEREFFPQVTVNNLQILLVLLFIFLFANYSYSYLYRSYLRKSIPIHRENNNLLNTYWFKSLVQRNSYFGHFCNSMKYILYLLEKGLNSLLYKSFSTASRNNKLWVIWYEFEYPECLCFVKWHTGLHKAVIPVI